MARDNSSMPNRAICQNATEAIADRPFVCDPWVRPRRNFRKRNTKDLPSNLSCFLEQGGEGRPLIRASTLQMSLCVQHIRVSFSLYPHSLTLEGGGLGSKRRIFCLFGGTPIIKQRMKRLWGHWPRPGG